MPLTEQQAETIKKQLISQIENFPPEQREAINKQLQTMNKKQLEQFLIQNKLIKSEQETQKPEESASEECVFCSIAENKTPSYKIDENKSAIAVLEINPLSKGHSLIIPKKHDKIENQKSQVLTLAKKIAKKLKSKLKPKPEEVKIETAEIFSHGLVNVIPIYKNQKLEKKQASPQELQELQKKLEKKKKSSVEYKKKTRTPKILPQAPKRIP